MNKAYVYRQAILAVNPGAVNLSGLGRDMGDFLWLAEHELDEVDDKVRESIDIINRAVDIAWTEKSSTQYVNTHPMVQQYVVRLSNMAFVTEEMRRVASHPTIRLVVDQMRQLTGAMMPDDLLYLERWSEAYDACVEYVKEAERKRKEGLQALAEDSFEEFN